MHSKETPRRRHSLEFEERVLAACAEPGASIAAMARSFELNDNLVQQWRRFRLRRRQPEFVEVSLPTQPEAAAPSESVRIELKRGALGVNVPPQGLLRKCLRWRLHEPILPGDGGTRSQKR